jgi:hypothetical protein
MDIFGTGFADPYSFGQALGGQPTYRQQVNRQAGQIVSAIGSKLPGTAGQVAQRVGQLVTGAASTAPPITVGQSVVSRTPSGQYHTRTTFAMEQGGRVLIGGGRGSILPLDYKERIMYKEKGGKIKKKNVRK